MYGQNNTNLDQNQHFTFKQYPFNVDFYVLIDFCSMSNPYINFFVDFFIISGLRVKRISKYLQK